MGEGVGSQGNSGEEGNQPVSQVFTGSPGFWWQDSRSTSFILRKSTTMNAGEGVEKREPSCTVGGNVN